MSHYDLAVIGADLGGLATAALLSAKGRKAVVFAAGEHLDASLGGLERDGFTFTPGPSLLAVGGQGTALRMLFGDAKAGVLPGHPADVYQVALPDRRITLNSNRERLREELDREFSRDSRSIEQFFRDMDRSVEKAGKSRIAAFLARRKTAAAFLGAYSFSRELHCFFSLLSNYFYRLPLADLMLPDLAGIILQGPLKEHGIRVGMARQLAGRIVQSGGEVHFSEGAAEPVIKSRRVTGVAASRGTVDARTVLFSARNPHQAVLYAGIHETVIPLGMEKDVIYLPDYGKPEEFLSLSLSSEQDERAAPPGMRAMTCVLNGGGPAESKESLISRVEGLIPFLRDFTVMSEAKVFTGPKGKQQDMQFKSVPAGVGSPVLFQTSVKGMYFIEEDWLTPLQQVQAASKLAKKIGP